MNKPVLDTTAERARPALAELAERMGITAEGLGVDAALDALRGLLDAVQGHTPTIRTGAGKPTPPIVAPADRFAHPTPSNPQAVRLHIMRSAFTLLTTTIEEATQPGRYRALALTALEEAAMWVNKSIMHEPKS